MSLTTGIFSDLSERNSRATLCRLCMQNNNHSNFNIFTSHVVCEITVEDALQDFVGLRVAVGDGLPATICPQCFEKLMDFCDFRKICFESDAKLRVLSSINYYKRIRGERSADEELESSDESEDCFRNATEGSSQLECQVQKTEIYIPVPDCQSPRANMVFSVKEEKGDQLDEGHHPALCSTDPSASDALDPLASDDLIGTGTCRSSSVIEGQIIDGEEGHGHIDYTEDASSELMPQASANQSTSAEKEESVENWEMVDETMVEALDARGKLRQAEKTSDINSKAYSGKRKRRRVRKFSSSSEPDIYPDDAQEDMRENLPKFPPPPANAMCRKTSRTSTPMLLEDDMQSHGTLPMEEKPKVYDLSDSDEDFKKHVTQQLSMLRSMVALNRELLESVVKQLPDIKAQQNGGCSEVTVSSPFVENFLKISTEDELRAVEEELKNESFADKMVVYLRKIGGNSASDATRRTMRRIFDDDMASEFSLYGAGSKRSFMGLRLGRIVIRAVQESMAAPEKDVEVAIRNWLRHAKERLQGKKKMK